MMFVVVGVFLVKLLISDALICDSPSYLYKKQGDVMISAIIAAHSGDDCSQPSNSGLQLIGTIIRSMDAIQANNMLPGLKIGLSVYDSCSHGEMAKKSIISALVDAECSDSYFLGIMVEEDVERQVRNLTSGQGVYTFSIKTTISDNLRSSIIAKVIHDLHLHPINKLISPDNKIRDEFLQSASSLGLCVQKELSANEVHKIEVSDTVLVLSNYSTIKNVVPLVTDAKLILVPTDGKYEQIKDLQASQVLIMLPTTLENPTLLNPFNITEKSSRDQMNSKIKSRINMQQIQSTADLLKMIGDLKSHIKKHCQIDNKWSLCPHLPKIPIRNNRGSTLDSIDSIKSTLKFLRVGLEEFEAMAVVELVPDLQHIGTIKLYQDEWALNSEINITNELKLCKDKPTNDSNGLDCSGCMNFNLIYKTFFEQKLDLFSSIVLKQEAWVAALLSISAVGVICCIAITIFIIVRICKKDMLEGNPGFSFVLLLSLILMYLSILPFSFEISDEDHYYKGLFCGLKIFGTSLSYSLVFSIMLARSFMLASCDEDGGFMSHINGYLQTVLFFFIAAVQVALMMQFWAINWLLLSHQQCTAMSQGPLFLFLLGYDMFLLLLLLSISPFIMRSKRNYQEGGYFTVSALICLGVWVAWCTGYMLLPQWEAVFVSCGLVATATVILVSVFIPRTYLMLTGIVRDHIVSTLPSLNHASTASIVDVNYRSTQALYDSVTIPRGNANPNFYADRPTTPSTSKMDDDRIDNPYERYDRSPSPHNITRF